MKYQDKYVHMIHFFTPNHEYTQMKLVFGSPVTNFLVRVPFTSLRQLHRIPSTVLSKW